MYHRILVPLDGSALAEAALPHAASVARCFGVGLTLLQVVPSTPIPTPVDPMGTSGEEAVIALDAVEASEQAASDYLEEVAGRPILEGVPVDIEVARGRPAREIVSRAQAGDVDLIAMSTHGRSGLGRLVFGSVADRVLRDAGIPILLIKPKEESRE